MKTTETCKDKILSVRLDEETENKLKEIMEARGLNKTEAVKFCINGTKILQIGKVKDLAGEFYKIRVALEKGDLSNEILREVNELCQSISDLIQKIEMDQE